MPPVAFTASHLPVDIIVVTNVVPSLRWTNLLPQTRRCALRASVGLHDALRYRLPHCLIVLLSVV